MAPPSLGDPNHKAPITFSFRPDCLLLTNSGLPFWSPVQLLSFAITCEASALHYVPSASNTIPSLSILFKTQLKSHLLQEKPLQKPSKTYLTLQYSPNHAKHSLQATDSSYMKYKLNFFMLKEFSNPLIPYYTL